MLNFLKQSLREAIERKILMSLALLFFCFCFERIAIEAAPKKYSYDEDVSTTIREMRDSLEDMRHELKNHESEIRMYEEKLSNQEAMIDTLRQHVNDNAQIHKDLLKEASTNLDIKISGLDSTVKALVADLRQFKMHANDSTAALAQYKQKISELEKVIEIQNQNMENLQTAIRTLMDALQVKVGVEKVSPSSASSSSSSGKIYRVKAGDSLEKIARSNQTSVQAIQELNNLTTTRIVVGQALQMP